MPVPTEEMLKMLRASKRRIGFFAMPTYKGPRSEPNDPGLQPIFWTALRYAREKTADARRTKIFRLKTKLEDMFGFDAVYGVNPVDELEILAHVEGIYAGLRAGFFLHRLAVKIDADDRLRFILNCLRKTPDATAAKICAELDWQLGRHSHLTKMRNNQLRLIAGHIAELVRQSPDALEKNSESNDALCKYLDAQIERLSDKRRPPLPLPSWGFERWSDALGAKKNTRDETVRNRLFNYLAETKELAASKNYQLLRAWEKVFDRRGKPKRRQRKRINEH